MRRLLSFLLCLSLGLFICVLTWLLVTGYDSKPSTSLVEKSGQRPLSISGMAYDTYRNEQLASSIKVENLQVRPRKIGIFRVKSLNEVALTKARFDLYQRPSYAAGEPTAQEGQSLTSGFSEGLNGLASLRGMGRITRATIDSMILNLHRAKGPYLQLRSRSAILDLKKQNFQFINARLLGRQGAFHLVTPLLKWDEQRKLFYVPGKYRLLTSDGQLRGSGAVIDSELNLRPLPGGTPPQARP